MAEDALIADEAELEAFSKLPANERNLTHRLKGVLAETACTGVIRYKWALVRPVLVHLMEQQLQEFEAAEHVDVGPARPLMSGDDSVSGLSERFTGLLWAFAEPPWTLQRLCEVLLEPRKQYVRLHKLALALEKLLLVTGEAHVTPSPGPPPRLSQLTRINEASVSAAAAAGGAGGATVGQKRPRPEDAEAGGLVAAALTVKQVQPQADGTAAAAAAAAADTPPAAAGPTAAVGAVQHSSQADNNLDAIAKQGAVGDQPAAGGAAAAGTAVEAAAAAAAKAIEAHAEPLLSDKPGSSSPAAAAAGNGAADAASAAAAADPASGAA